MEFGESPVDSVRRESLEEVGAEVDVGGILTIHDNVYSRSDGSGMEHGIRLVFEGVLMGAVVDVGGAEIDEVGWFKVSDLPTPVTDWARLGCSSV